MSSFDKELHTLLLRKELVHRFICYYTFLQREEKKDNINGQYRPFKPVDFDPLITYNAFDDE